MNRSQGDRFGVIGQIVGPRPIAAGLFQLIDIGHNFLQRSEPDIFRGKGVFKPALDDAPSGQTPVRNGCQMPIQNPPASYCASNSSKEAARPSVGDFTGIMKDDNIDAAWDWISFWGEKDAAIALLEATGYFPASTAALEDERIKTNPIYQAASQTLDFGRLPNSFVGAAGWSENVVNPTFQSVLTGQLTPEQAVDRMIEGLETALR